MLNIDVNINLDVNRKQYPVRFEKKNICVHCGSENSLIFVDKFNRETKKEIYAFEHLKCKNCGRIFSIYWQMDEDTNRMFPTAVEPSMKLEFFNLLSTPKLKKSAKAEFEN